jgi:hypothetical protein
MLSLGLCAVLLAFQASAGSPPPQLPSEGPHPAPDAVAADTGVLRHANNRTPPLVYAARVDRASGPIHIDGKLDEPIWATARAATQFYQTAPHEGEPATERTDVRIAYDEDAIYIGARLLDSDPRGVRGQLARRDAATEADLFEVAIDSYHDHNTSFVFGINPSGVKTDRVVGQDGFSSDDSWDPVWEVAVRTDETGWTVEMRIPLSQLRFSPAVNQVWGINFFRRIHRKAEQAVYAYSKPSDRGYASYFAHLLGIQNLPKSRRVEIAPYATTRQERIDPGVAHNPFNDGSRQVAGAGLDAKVGVTSGLTLAATVNPDFGQVDADPAFVNLSAFEQFLNERRPFFVEGADIFSFNSTDQLFYSRRIGRAPQGSANDRDGFVDAPDHTTILGAGKLSGRVGAWSLGMLEATTAHEYAVVDSSGTRFRDEVEPLTNYFIARGQRDWRGGADRLGFIGTAVNRRIDATALNFLRTSAYVGGFDFGHRFAGNVYNLTGSIVGSRIAGDTTAIQRAQLSSARYYQRPDAKVNRYDPLATSLSGWNGSVNLGKEVGDVQFSVSASAKSPGFEVNDAGFQTNADAISYFGFVNRRWTKPNKVFRLFFVGNNLTYTENFDGVRKALQYNANANATFLNYWNADAHFTAAARVQSDNLTRGGPLAEAAAFWSASGGVGTDTRRRFSTYNGASYARNEIHGWNASYFSSIDFRPSTATTISIQPSYTVYESKQQYTATQTDATATNTYGRRYLFSEVLQHSLDLTTRLNLTFRPNLSLQIYTQPFVATGDFHNLKELARAGSLDYVVYGNTGASTLQCFNDKDVPTSCDTKKNVSYFVADPDGAGPRPALRLGNNSFNSRSLNGNAVVRWEYRPGSTMFFVWSTSCATDAVNPQFSANYDVRHLCQGPSNNVFAVKANYWLSF